MKINKMSEERIVPDWFIKSEDNIQKEVVSKREVDRLKDLSKETTDEKLIKEMDIIEQKANNGEKYNVRRSCSEIFFLSI